MGGRVLEKFYVGDVTNNELPVFPPPRWAADD
jgi:hypothetical protein